MPQPAFHGPLPAVGTVAPTLRYVKADRHEASLLDHRGHVVVLIAFPSVDTSTCAREMRAFNSRATELGAHVLSISLDLPFALKRFCAALMPGCAQLLRRRRRQTSATASRATVPASQCGQ